MDEEEANPPHEPAELKRNARIGAGVAPPERLTLVTKIKEADWYKEEETSKAVKCELKQLFHEELKTLLPVKTLPVGEVALGSHMFVTVKHTATGVYDKMKARLVADGSQQDASWYLDKSSPTLAMHSLYTKLAMYAGLSGYLMAKVDIKGAFVQTPMEGLDVYMRIHR